MRKIIIAVTLIIVSSVINAAPVSNIEITGGTFSLDAGVENYPIVPGEFSVLTVGGYDGGAQISADPSQNTIAYFIFGAYGTVAISTQADPINVGANYRPVTGDITNDILTLDLDSWTAWFAGVFFNQGANDTCLIADFILIFEDVCSSGPAVISYDSTTGVFTASWSSVVTTGVFYGQVGTWNITGLVSEGTSLSVVLNVTGGVSQECSQQGGTLVSMNADVVTNDAYNLNSVDWTVNNSYVGSGVNIQHLLPLGINEISVTASLYSGETRTVSTQVVIEDTTPPVVNAAFTDARTGGVVTSINEKTELLTSISVVDVCDASPVTNSTVGMPTVDGNPIGIIKGRSGITLKTGSIVDSLALQAIATDASGNVSTGEASVLIQ